jgi:hypothetical protein
VVLAAGASAHGLDYPVWNSHRHHHHKPEIDPNLAVSALTLLGGTLAVLRIRRKR